MLGVDCDPPTRSCRWPRIGLLADLTIALGFVALTVPIFVSGIWMQVVASKLDAYQSVDARSSLLTSAGRRSWPFSTTPSRTGSA